MDDVVDPSTAPSSSSKHSDPLADNQLLRSSGYAARIARAIAPALTRGSRYLAYTSDVGEAFRPIVAVQVVRVGLV